jgi:hypothetical protein
VPKFDDNVRVALVEDYICGLKAGDIGEIWCVYDDNLSPQAYEVLFICRDDGKEAQFFMYEFQLKAVPTL